MLGDADAWIATVALVRGLIPVDKAVAAHGMGVLIDTRIIRSMPMVLYSPLHLVASAVEAKLSSGVDESPTGGGAAARAPDVRLAHRGAGRLRRARSKGRCSAVRHAIASRRCSSTRARSCARRTRSRIALSHSARHIDPTRGFRPRLTVDRDAATVDDEHDHDQRVHRQASTGPAKLVSRPTPPRRGRSGAGSGR